MAATYDPNLTTAKDRVRFMIRDKAATFVFQDEEIGAALVLFGTTAEETERNDLAEIQAGIFLLEAEGGGSGTETTIRQGSVTRTYKDGAGDRTAILASLRRRLASLVGLEEGTSADSVLAVGKYDPRESDEIWPTGCGYLTPPF